MTRTVCVAINVLLLLIAHAVRPVHGQSASQSIAEQRFVAIGGIEQWTTIRGDSTTSPILLVVHGGPAEVQSPLASVYEPLEKHFVVVQWDQRGAGKTYGRNVGPNELVTLEQIARDGLELSDYLIERFNTRQIVLFGHSWGSLVGVTMAQQRPELFSNLITSGQVSSWRETVSWQHNFALRKARESGDEQAVQALASLGVPAPDDLGQYFTMRRHLAKHFAKADLDWLSRLAILYASAPGVKPEDLKSMQAAGAYSLQRLMPAVVAADLLTNAPRVNLPVCVIQGSDDVFTPTELAERYFVGLDAPQKFIRVIPDAGHFAAMTHTAEFVDALTGCVALGHGSKGSVLQNTKAEDCFDKLSANGVVVQLRPRLRYSTTSIK